LLLRGPIFIIEGILKQFSKDKSPGSEGWTMEFYLEFLDILGVEILEVIEESRVKGVMSGALNSTFMALILKRDKPKNFMDFRPISLCNLIYKVISKFISNIIKPYLAKLISREQIGFLNNRQILEAIGVT